MLKELVNRFRGQTWVRVEAPFPERVLNLCSARGLAFWDLVWESETVFTCRLSRRDCGRLKRAMKNLEGSVTVVRGEGVPFFLGRFRRRQVLLVGLTACALWATVSSFFIWDFTVEGNVTVTEEEILRALEKNGVGLGTLGLGLDTEDLRNHILLEIPELSWITVNVSGCRATVQVRERIPVPELVSKRQPTNVVARRAGLVLKVQALDGVACVLPGSSVTEGQILISGVEDTETLGARVLTGMGTVEARTWYTLTAHVPLTAPVKKYTGEEKTFYSLVFGTNRIKLFSNSGMETGSYDKITTRDHWSLFGFPLPVTLERETCRYYETEMASVDVAAAEAAAEEALTEYLHTLVDDYGTVSSTLCSSHQRGGVLTVTLSAECVEQIGETVPIYTEESGPESP